MTELKMLAVGLVGVALIVLVYGNAVGLFGNL
jgi:hypothetical protein